MFMFVMNVCLRYVRFCFSVPTKRLAGNSISKMTYFLVSSGMLNLEPASQSVSSLKCRLFAALVKSCIHNTHTHTHQFSSQFRGKHGLISTLRGLIVWPLFPL